MGWYRHIHERMLLLLLLLLFTAYYYLFLQPERISGGDYTFQSDIWSFGLTMFEIAMSHYPYPTADLDGRGGQLGFWDLLDLIVQKPSPQLPADQFSPEFVDFLNRWFVFEGYLLSVSIFQLVCL